MFLVFGVCVLLTGNERTLDQLKELMNIHQFWDVYLHLTRMIETESSSVNITLHALRAQCSLNLFRYKAVLNDIEIILANSPSPAEARSAYALRTETYLQLGEFATAASAEHHDISFVGNVVARCMRAFETKVAELFPTALENWREFLRESPGYCGFW
jgi:hypothetical protein